MKYQFVDEDTKQLSLPRGSVDFSEGSRFNYTFDSTLIHLICGAWFSADDLDDAILFLQAARNKLRDEE